MARMTKAQKEVEAKIAEAFRIHGNYVQIPMMKLGEDFQAGRLAAAQGGNIEEAVKAKIQAVRVN